MAPLIEPDHHRSLYIGRISKNFNSQKTKAKGKNFFVSFIPSNDQNHCRINLLHQICLYVFPQLPTLAYIHAFDSSPITIITHSKIQKFLHPHPIKLFSKLYFYIYFIPTNIKISGSIIFFMKLIISKAYKNYIYVCL